MVGLGLVFPQQTKESLGLDKTLCFINKVEEEKRISMNNISCNDCIR